MIFWANYTDTILSRIPCPHGFIPITRRIWIWYRAGGDVLCPICGKLYYDHSPEKDPEFCERHTEHWTTHQFQILCNGDRVHL